MGHRPLTQLCGASMEPSSGDDGEPLVAAVRRSPDARASMEPSSGDDGEVAPTAHSAARSMLQWSRRPGTTESCDVRGLLAAEVMTLQWSRRPGTTERRMAIGALVERSPVLQWSRRPGTTERPRVDTGAWSTATLLQWSRRPGTTERGTSPAPTSPAPTSLQWSRRPGTTERWGRYRHGRGLHTASMEPSSGDDGEGSLLLPCRSEEYVALQWSRRPGTTERRHRRWPGRRLGVGQLQWSRRPGTTERARTRTVIACSSCFNGAVVRGRRRVGRPDRRRRRVARCASMEPSSGDDGEGVDGDGGGAGEWSPASMEPSSGDDGEPSRCSGGAWSLKGLQWSRRPGTTESTHFRTGDDTLAMASMEPSSGDDGENTTHHRADPEGT